MTHTEIPTTKQLILPHVSVQNTPIVVPTRGVKCTNYQTPPYNYCATSPRLYQPTRKAGVKRRPGSGIGGGGQIPIKGRPGQDTGRDLY